MRPTPWLVRRLTPARSLRDRVARARSASTCALSPRPSPTPMRFFISNLIRFPIALSSSRGAALLVPLPDPPARETDKGKEPIVDDDSEEEEVDAETSDEEEEEPVKKKQKVEKKKKKKSDDSDDDSVNSDVVDDLSGDEVDTSNIIEGGRRARRGRPVSFTYAANDSDEDSDED